MRIGPLAVLLITTALLGTSADPAKSLIEDCWAFTDWWQSEPSMQTGAFHMWIEGDHPDEQIPEGEWEYLGGVDNRSGSNHASLYPMWSISGGHPACE